MRIHIKQLNEYKAEELPFDIELSDTDGCITKYLGNASEVVIPDTCNGRPITYIDANAFEGCTSIVKIDCGKVEDIFPEAFKGCTSLVEVKCPFVTNIHSEAFKGCIALKEIDCINIENVFADTFEGCKALEANLPNLNPKMVNMFRENGVEF